MLRLSRRWHGVYPSRFPFSAQLPSLPLLSSANRGERPDSSLVAGEELMTPVRRAPSKLSDESNATGSLEPRPVSQKRSNIINETQGDLHLQPSFALVAKKEKNTRKLCHYKVWGS